MSDVTILARDATFSPCEAYRYELFRELDTGDDASGEFVTFVMLNPSTADAFQEDPTVRRCLGYAVRWGYDHVYVVNIFALRSTDPKALKAAKDPIGPLNDEAILRCCDPVTVNRVVLAWGSHGDFRGRGDAVRKMICELRRGKAATVQIGTDRTKSGQPRHPLYLRADLKTVPVA